MYIYTVYIVFFSHHKKKLQGYLPTAKTRPNLLCEGDLELGVLLKIWHSASDMCICIYKHDIPYQSISNSLICRIYVRYVIHKNV